MNLKTLVTAAKDYGKEITSSRASWTDFTKQVAKSFGNRTLLDYTTMFNNMDAFLVRSNSWTIGGAVFNGIMSTEHLIQVNPTHYPVQTGSVMTDHSILQPAELTIEILVSDAQSNTANWGSVRTGNKFVDRLIDGYGKVQKFKNLQTMFSQPGQVASAGERGVSAWALLKSMAEARIPVDIVTRLGTYHNMLIQSVNAPDELSTLYGLRVSIHCVQIQVSNVAEVAVSARKQVSQSTNGGVQPVDTGSDANKKSVLKAIDDSL